MTAQSRSRLSTARGREIGQLLREARQSTDLSTIDMGKALGRPQPNVCRLENGDRGTSDEQLMFYIGYCRASKDVQKQMRALLKERDYSYLVRPHTPQFPGRTAHADPARVLGHQHVQLRVVRHPRRLVGVAGPVHRHGLHEGSFGGLLRRTCRQPRPGGTACVEIAFGQVAAVRDSKNATGPVLDFRPADWRAFLGTVE